jgi:RecA/RadA recombinase
VSPVDPARREEFIEYLLKEHKDEAESIIYRMHGPQIRIPFVSPMLTWATSGGVPLGHFCRWYGPEGSGKSLTNWGLMYGAQKFPEVVSQWYEVDVKFFERRGKKLAASKVKSEMKQICERFPNGMEAIIFDTEQRADLEFAQRMGVDTKRIEVVNNNVTEEIIKDATKALSAFHIVIIDSASNAQSVAEAQLEPGAYEQGTGAKAWSRLKQFRKVMDRHANVLIIVDQMRSTGLGGSNKMYRGPDAAPPNVRFLRHNASVAIEYETGKKLYLDKAGQLTDDYDKASPDIRSLGTNGKEPHGLEMRCKVMKNSTGKPYRNARMRFTFPVYDHRTGESLQEVGFDTAFELVEIASHFDIIEKGSSGRYYPLDDEFNRIPRGGKSKTDVSWHGENAARQGILEDEAMQERIFARLRRDM